MRHEINLTEKERKKEHRLCKHDIQNQGKIMNTKLAKCTYQSQCPNVTLVSRYFMLKLINK